MGVQCIMKSFQMKNAMKKIKTDFKQFFLFLKQVRKIVRAIFESLQKMSSRYGNAKECQDPCLCQSPRLYGIKTLIAFE